MSVSGYFHFGFILSRYEKTRPLSFELSKQQEGESLDMPSKQVKPAKLQII